jgi:hypothetical protein
MASRFILLFMGKDTRLAGRVAWGEQPHSPVKCGFFDTLIFEFFCNIGSIKKFSRLECCSDAIYL